MKKCENMIEVMRKIADNMNMTKLSPAQRTARAEQKIADRILADLLGPQVVGSRCWCGYWGATYTVTAIHADGKAQTGMSGPAITIRWDARPGRPEGETTHCTRWDARRDRIIS